MDGITATTRLRALPHPPKVITLTTFDLDEYVYNSLAAGADGFLLKDTDPAEILRAVHLVAAGSAMLHPTAARLLIDRYHATNQPRATAARAGLERLTPRERDVLALLARGDTNADIAVHLSSASRSPWPSITRPCSIRDANYRSRPARKRRTSCSVSVIPSGTERRQPARGSARSRPPTATTGRPARPARPHPGHGRVHVPRGEVPGDEVPGDARDGPLSCQAGESPVRGHASHHHEGLGTFVVRAAELAQAARGGGVARGGRAQSWGTTATGQLPWWTAAWAT